jgi:tRNA dimethylallyltransferase
MKPRSRILVVVGPTASGKSAFAQELALSCHGEILNADSQQFYRGFDIGTGKVPSEEQKVRHWLLDICEPGAFVTAMDFAREADEVIETIFTQGKVPIVVGGTGLYIRALLEGLDALPPRDPVLRAELQSQYEREGGLAFHERLHQVDPLSAVKISPQDSSRLVRFLEIYRITGKAPSTLMRRQSSTRLRYEAHTHWLRPEREALRNRIAQRVREMLASGWLEEVRRLMLEGKDPRYLANKPIGYAELAEVVEGSADLEAMQNKIILKTQQYAKRQETFFRGLFSSPAYSEEGCALKVVESLK